MATPDQTRPELVPLIDLEPAEAEAVQDAMANVGLEAVPYRLDIGAREGTMAKALVRIYVPRTQVRDARAVVRGVLPEYGATSDSRPETLPPSEEQAWAAIVADLRSDGLDQVVPPAPAAFDPLDHDERFVPPEPPPLVRPHRRTLLAWLGVFLGILIGVLGAVVFGGGVVSLLGIALFIGGFVGLIAQARQRDPDDYDDGAVI
ncbi:MAG: hypothetical protein QG597_2502 [Actinomycetota bacterium]|nr:hypothetical protein [Actinomycetota bacterium]